MTVERKDPDTIHGLSRAEAERFCDHDVLIRSGMCPNGCGLMSEDAGGQQCPSCGFFCNTARETRAQ